MISNGYFNISLERGRNCLSENVLTRAIKWLWAEQPQSKSQNSRILLKRGQASAVESRQLETGFYGWELKVWKRLRSGWLGRQDPPVVKEPTWHTHAQVPAMTYENSEVRGLGSGGSCGAALLPDEEVAIHAPLIEQAMTVRELADTMESAHLVVWDCRLRYGGGFVGTAVCWGHWWNRPDPSRGGWPSSTRHRDVYAGPTEYGLLP